MKLKSRFTARLNIRKTSGRERKRFLNTNLGNTKKLRRKKNFLIPQFELCKMPSTGEPMTEDLRRNSGTNYKKPHENGVLGHTLYFSKAQQSIQKPHKNGVLGNTLYFSKA